MSLSLGERLVELRKEKHLSQEEVADRLNVTRQTVSKWELDQSTPDFDKIIPLCELYEISTDQLLTGRKQENTDNTFDEDYIDPVVEEENKRKRVGALAFSIFLYFLAVAWIMISIPVLGINPVLGSAGFMLIVGIATSIIVYSQIVYKKKKTKKEKYESEIMKQIESILSILFCIIYLVVSFLTMAWHITWVIWIIYALVVEIAKLVIMLRGVKNEE